MYFDSLVELLRRNGHQVQTYTADNKALFKGLALENIRTKVQTAISIYWNKKVADDLAELISRFKPNIAHINNIYPQLGPTVYRILKRHKIPIIQTVHNYRLLCPKGVLFKHSKVTQPCINNRFLLNCLQNKCYRDRYLDSLVFSTAHLLHYRYLKSFALIDAFIFPSQFARDLHLTHLSLPPNKLHVIPYFVNLPQRNNTKQSTQIDCDYFLFVGHLNEVKGILPLLKLWQTLPSNIKLVVVGSGPLEKQVAQFNKYPNIDIRGRLPREEVLELMKSAIATVFPYLSYETGPQVLFESYAYRTPVLAPYFGSFIERVKEAKTGFFYRYNNWQDLKEKIVFTHKNTAAMDKMRAAAFLEYKDSYTPALHYEKLAKLYRRLTA